MVFTAEQSGQRTTACGTAQSVLIKTLQRRSSVPCVMSARAHQPGEHLVFISSFVLPKQLVQYAQMCT